VTSCWQTVLVDVTSGLGRRDADGDGDIRLCERRGGRRLGKQKRLGRGLGGGGHGVERGGHAAVDDRHRRLNGARRFRHRDRQPGGAVGEAQRTGTNNG
jgi:hypothetical protein